MCREPTWGYASESKENQIHRQCQEMQTGVSGTQLWYDSEKRANGPSRSVRHPLGDGPVKPRKGATEKSLNHQTIVPNTRLEMHQ